MEADRRTAPRSLRRLRVLVGGDTAFTADVTANGFCIETPRLAQPGTSISGTIRVGDREFAFTGMVCWARSDDPQHGRMGVRFLDVPREFQFEFASLH
ncbi:MAG: PilZ domain-containing protein [Deltaproteobacteria bacterium]|nr:MAG: PilZ domain-containing protein [Deltaproteobacteria bacterium]